MVNLKVARFIFVCVVVVCSINEVLCQMKATSAQISPHSETEHIHLVKKPCETCPRHGRCVPRIQCPAHLRPGSYNPECHLKVTGQIGICCFTGSSHAAEFELKSRQKASIDVEHMKSAHNYAHVMAKEMFHQSKKVLEQSENTIVHKDSPDFGQHLSFLSSDEREEKLGKGGLLNLFTAQELKNRQAISDHELLLGFTEHTDSPFCSPAPFCPTLGSRYRNITGECNSPSYPFWGAANTGFERLLPPDYSDGLWSLRVSISGLPLPSPRAVSRALVPDSNLPSGTHNLLFMQFSQFIAHDISSAVMYSIGNGSSISCCSPTGSPLPSEHLHFACSPITVGPDDEFFSQFRRTCLNFVRAQLAPDTDCTVGYAKPMNGATHFLDLSHIYGKTPEKLQVLRSGGMLKIFNDFGRELPPLTEKKECMSAKEHGACFESGDNHGNQVISLTAFHTIFTREHNRLSRALSRLNPLWGEDTVFYETRRLLQGMYQQVVYNEWLPLVLGPNLMKIFDLTPSSGYSSYDPHINPSLVTEFTAAAMRFGHSTVDGKIMIPNPKTGELYEAISIPEVMFEPSRLRLRHFLDRILYGMAYQPMQNVDPFVTEALTRYLFHGGSPHGLDLATLNIARGRDYGLRPYNYYRRLCGLEEYKSFDQFPVSARKRLSSVYSSPEDIDLWIGGLLEEPVDGGIVGPTFAFIIAEQFSRMKRGDRYFYEHGPEVNPGAFTESQLSEIKKVTLARIICDNIDGVEISSMPPRTFLRADLPNNQPVYCDSNIIPSMDLSRFRDV